MPAGRRKRMRRVWKEPEFRRFAPVGTRNADSVTLSVDEFEAVRLRDYEGVEQTGAAEKMGVSQPTFHRILESARRKLAQAIVEGKRMEIEGGDYMAEEKGVPKRDGSGMGRRANRGRGGCNPPRDAGMGRPCGRGRGMGRRMGRR